MKTILVLSFALAASLPCAANTFTLTPAGGHISGTPGSTVGWGFTIGGDATDWTVITAVQLGSDPFPVGSVANFKDLLSLWAGNNNYAIAPGDSLTQDYTAGLGLAEFKIPDINNAGDTTGPLTIDLEFDLYDANPFIDGNANYVASFESQATAQVDVVAPDVSGTPEPGTWALLATGLALITVSRRKLRGA